MSQELLFDMPLLGIFRPAGARNSDPVTSHEAAEAVTVSGQAAEQSARVLDALASHPDSTSLELAAASGIERHVVARRLPDLEKRGFVLRGAVRPCRQSPIGSRAVTWRAK